jgi:hypothetical protein
LTPPTVCAGIALAARDLKASTDRIRDVNT